MRSPTSLVVTLAALCGCGLFALTGCGEGGDGGSLPVAPADNSTGGGVTGDTLNGGTNAPGGDGTTVTTPATAVVLVGADPAPSATTPALVATQANNAVNTQLVSGTDYAGAVKNLTWAEAKDPANQSATFFLGAAEYLNFQNVSLTDPTTAGAATPAPSPRVARALAGVSANGVKRSS